MNPNAGKVQIIERLWSKKEEVEMHISNTKKPSYVGVCLLGFLFMVTPAEPVVAGDDLAAKQEALNIIADAADRICGEISSTGGGRKIEISGNAKAELNGLIKKMVDLGIEGAAKYEKSEYQNVLREDLAETLKTSTNCKLDVFRELKGDFFKKPERLSDIINNLKSPNVSTRIDSAIKLKDRGKAAAPAFPDLVSALGDNNLMFLEKVAEALVEIDSVAANPYLKQLSDRLYRQRGGGLIDGSKPEDSLLGMLEIWTY